MSDADLRTAPGHGQGARTGRPAGPVAPEAPRRKRSGGPAPLATRRAPATIAAAYSAPPPQAPPPDRVRQPRAHDDYQHALWERWDFSIDCLCNVLPAHQRHPGFIWALRDHTRLCFLPERGEARPAVIAATGPGQAAILEILPMAEEWLGRAADPRYPLTIRVICL
jgi:hypothetical protein